VKRVAKYDLRAYLQQLVGQHGFDGAIGADRHKDRSLHHAVIEGHTTPAGLSVGGKELKAQA
jgi:hypothetical protein